MSQLHHQIFVIVSWRPRRGTWVWTPWKPCLTGWNWLLPVADTCDGALQTGDSARSLSPKGGPEPLTRSHDNGNPVWQGSSPSAQSTKEVRSSALTAQAVRMPAAGGEGDKQSTGSQSCWAGVGAAFRRLQDATQQEWNRGAQVILGSQRQPCSLVQFLRMYRWIVLPSEWGQQVLPKYHWICTDCTASHSGRSTTFLAVRTSNRQAAVNLSASSFSSFFRTWRTLILKTEAMYSSETPLNFYHTIQRYIPQATVNPR
jgi:hypothetical protein